MKKPVKILIIILLFVILFFLTMFIFLSLKINDMKKKIVLINIENIDIKNLKNGEYSGECNVDLVKAKVKVTINNGKITNIIIINHEHGPGYGADKIIDRIIEKQTLNVDSISGATGSSKVIKKAIEDALKKAI